MVRDSREYVLGRMLRTLLDKGRYSSRRFLRRCCFLLRTLSPEQLGLLFPRVLHEAFKTAELYGVDQVGHWGRDLELFEMRDRFHSLGSGDRVTPHWRQVRRLCPQSSKTSSWRESGVA